MRIDFIPQPYAEFRLGDFLKSSLAGDRWNEFRAAIAFVKRSGTKHIKEPLEAFSKRGSAVKISVGVDAGGTSAEGLTDLIRAVEGRGEIFVYKNANSSTFHPKIYLFKNEKSAELLVGSGNLTEGGLFTNYEGSLLVRLDLTNPNHASLTQSIVQALDGWSTPKSGECYLLDISILEQLVKGGHIPDEVKAWGDEKVATDDEKKEGAALFFRRAVPAAPKTPRPADLDASEFMEAEPEEIEDLVVVKPPPVAEQRGINRVFLMTLQRTDVGVGQTSIGTSRRSPEIFIPLMARDADPEFWGWPDLFVEDPTWTGPVDSDGHGKMDRSAVMVRLGGAIFPVNMWYNPDKRDLRLRSEHMRSAGTIGDILYLERSDGREGFTYYADVVPQGSPRHTELLDRCTNAVRNSKKVFGYY